MVKRKRVIKSKKVSKISSLNEFFYENFRDYFSYNSNGVLLKYCFKEQLISLLEQKYPENSEIQTIVNYLKILNSKDKGISFEEYIENWIRRLTNNATN